MAVAVTVVGLTVVMMFVKFLLAMTVIETVAALTVLYWIWTAVKRTVDVQQRVVPKQKEYMVYQVNPWKRFN